MYSAFINILFPTPRTRSSKQATLDERLFALDLAAQYFFLSALAKLNIRNPHDCIAHTNLHTYPFPFVGGISVSLRMYHHQLLIENIFALARGKVEICENIKIMRTNIDLNF